MPSQANKYIHQILATALAIYEGALLYPICFTALLPG